MKEIARVFNMTSRHWQTGARNGKWISIHPSVNFCTLAAVISCFSMKNGHVLSSSKEEKDLCVKLQGLIWRKSIFFLVWPHQVIHQLTHHIVFSTLN